MNPLESLRRSLRARLLGAHLLVIAVGVVTVFLAVAFLAPTFFGQRMATMMMSGHTQQPGNHPMMGMMGPGSPPPPAGPPPGDIMGAMAEMVAPAFQQSVLLALLIGGAAATLTAVLASLFLSRAIAAPAENILKASRRIAAGHYYERVPVGSQDELGAMAASFNEMASSLENTERRRMELVGDVAHELRTPIATIQGYAEGLIDGVVEPCDRTWNLLHGEAERLRRLVEDLQELSRAEAGQLRLERRAVSPQSMVAMAVEGMRPQFQQKGVVLDCSLSERLPSVLADQDRIAQVLSNLLSNALRYTPAGGRVEVGAELDANHVLLRVRDTGAGISAEDLPHVFDRFYRADKSRSRAAGGTGVGLTIARALVEAHGGRIWAESPRLGQGATFFFTLPAA